MNTFRSLTQRCSIALSAIAVLHGAPLHAQLTRTIIPISPDEYLVVVPTTCPTHLAGGLTGWLFGYPNAGYEWTAEWNRVRIPNPDDYSHADYHPEAYDGYAAGKGQYINSRDGNARWYNPELYVECTATWKYVFGLLVGVDERYHVLDNRGSVEVICNNGGGGRGGLPLNDPAYDPYDPYWDVSGGTCSNDGTGQSNGGDSCHSEYIYIDESTDGGATWHEIWEGWATVCD